MPEKVDLGTAPQLPPQPSPSPAPGPAPSPQPSPGLLPLPQSIAGAALIGPNSKATTLNEIFTTQYLLIDYSQLGCGYCVQHARAVNNDQKFKDMMAGQGKCKSLTVVSTSQVDSWITQFDRDLGNISTFSGKTSYGYETGATGFGRLLGVKITGTPTVQLIDRTGKVVVQDGRSNPQQVEGLCR
jgi:hypothetical protein